MTTFTLSSKITVPKLTAEETKALRDYWMIYEEHRAEISANLIRLAEDLPDFKFILQNSASQPSPEQQQANIEKQRRAIYDGEWEPYLENLWAQGKQYAQIGLNFHSWFEIVSAFRKLMRPYV